MAFLQSWAAGLSAHKFLQESPFSVITPKGVRCQICPNNCLVLEGETGKCRTHLVRSGKLYTNAYGNPCAVHVDPIEKKPLFHFLPSSSTYSIATAGCNLACLNCQNWEISQQTPSEIQNVELFPEKAVSEAIRNSCQSIAYTYTEPVAFYEYMLETAKTARLHGIRNLMISNGYINEKPLRNIAKYIDAANIDLKSFHHDTYVKLTGGSLQPILNTLKVLKEEGVWLEITSLILPGWNDSSEMISEMCDWLYTNGFKDTPLHFSRFYPLHKLNKVPPTPEATLSEARETALNAGLNYVYIGNVHGSMAENTQCPKCKAVVILRNGFAVLKNDIKNGSCGFCGHVIAGVWS
jgi:pyruvate formate lyase activating enzyme